MMSIVTRVRLIFRKPQKEKWENHQVFELGEEDGQLGEGLLLLDAQQRLLAILPRTQTWSNINTKYSLDTNRFLEQIRRDKKEPGGELSSKLESNSVGLGHVQSLHQVPLHLVLVQAI